MSHPEPQKQFVVLVPKQREVRMHYGGSELVLERLIDEAELREIQLTRCVRVTVPRVYLAALSDHMRDF